MSDSKVNNNLVKSRGIVQKHNSVNEIAEYNSSKSITPATELLIEFLSAVMTKDYELALRHCTEILNREPNNLTALEFYPLIVEKLEMLELEGTSSDSSLSSSSSASSSGSEKNLFRSLDEETLYEWGRSRASSIEPSSLKKIEEGAVSSTKVLKKESTKENTKTAESNISLEAKPKQISLPNVELYKKKNKNDTPSNLLIHPTETITLIGNNVSHKRSKTPSRPKQERRSANVSQQQPSKILLHTTQTVTFLKGMTTPNLERKSSGAP